MYDLGFNAVGVGLFFLQWWAICLIIAGFSLTVLGASFMIVWLTKKLWRQFFPEKHYTPDYRGW